jgi:ABC-type uncharacterized transport system substrate-binding protein
MVAKELVNLQPDVIFAANTPLAAALQLETRTIPIVFVIVGDPVELGLAESLSHPWRKSYWFHYHGSIDGGQVAGVAHGDRA